jgi:hypothetical protein
MLPDRPSPLDFAREESRRIDGLRELELGNDHPWFVVFRSERPPGAIILYHTPGGNRIGYTEDVRAVGSIVTEICERLKVTPADLE